MRWSKNTKVGEWIYKHYRYFHKRLELFTRFQSHVVKDLVNCKVEWLQKQQNETQSIHHYH